MSFKNKTLLITGGAGFIGSHLCERLILHKPEKLIIVDDFSLGKERNIKNIRKSEKVIVYRKDASNYDLMTEVYEIENVDITYNLAVHPLPESYKNPKKIIDTNILITTNLCELLFKGKYSTLIHVSSSEAYGTSVYVDRPMSENHPTFPTTPYAASKLACDHIVLSYYKTLGLDVAIARPFNSYGPRQNEGSYAGVIPITVCRILSGKPPIIHGDGLQTRDYTYVKDIVDGMCKIYEKTSTRGEIVNLASSKSITIKRLIYMIMDIMGYSGDVIYTDARPGDVRHHRGDISLAKRLLGYNPVTSFEKGLRETIKWYMEESNYTN